MIPHLSFGPKISFFVVITFFLKNQIAFFSKNDYFCEFLIFIFSKKRNRIQIFHFYLYAPASAGTNLNTFCCLNYITHKLRSKEMSNKNSCIKAEPPSGRPVIIQLKNDVLTEQLYGVDIVKRYSCLDNLEPAV